MTTLFEDLEWRGLIYQVTDPTLRERMNAGGLTAYIGFDPTADSLHVGHLLQLLVLRRLQLAGNSPIVLAGGATGMIGDPSFKSAERTLLDEATLQKNIDGIRGQLTCFLDFDGPCAARLVNNYSWTSEVNVIEFLREIGKYFSVNSLLARESVRARLEDREQGISFTEFSYTLLQANDFLHLFSTYNCSLQMGARDQWGNIVSGVDLIRRVRGEQVFGAVTPLVTKSDGTKFGKTESGTVWLSRERTSPYALYQFFLGTADADVVPYLKFFTFLSHEEITALEDATRNVPQRREAQRVLARALVSLIHGEDALRKAVAASESLFGESIANVDRETLDDVAREAPCADIAFPCSVVDALVASELCGSKSAARTAIQQGGVAVNGARVEDVDATIIDSQLLHGTYVVLRRGKKAYAFLRRLL